MFELADMPDRLKQYPDALCFWFIRPGKETHFRFSDLDEISDLLADRLVERGVCRESIVGIRLGNCVDWVIWDIAAIKVGFTIQAFPDDEEIYHPEELLRRNHLSVLVTAPFEDLRNPDVTTAIWGELNGKAGREFGDDVWSLVYSSGTSGTNKGLMISRLGTEFVVNRFIKDYSLTQADRCVIFLPMYNYQQRLTVYGCIAVGADIVITDFQQSLYSTKSIPPTFIIAPPVFYETVMRLAKATAVRASQVLGGEVRFAITGMAPINPGLLESFGEQGVPLFEAYGSTETGMISWNTPLDARPGSVGKPLVDEHLIIGDEGEVRVSRPAPLSIRYFDTDKELEESVFLSDGSIDVGDFGKFDEDGFLYLLGRRNDVIVTPSGKKVHPSVIEQAAMKVLGVSDLAVVYDNSRKEIVLVMGSGEVCSIESPENVQAQINRSLPAYSRISQVVIAGEKINGNPEYMTKNMKLSRRKISGKYCSISREAS